MKNIVKTPLYTTSLYNFETSTFNESNYKKILYNELKSLSHENLVTNLYYYYDYTDFAKLKQALIKPNSQSIGFKNFHLISCDTSEILKQTLCFYIIFINTLILASKKMVLKDCIEPEFFLWDLIAVFAIVEDLLSKEIFLENKNEFLHKFRKKVYFGLFLLINPKDLENYILNLLEGALTNKTILQDYRICIHFCCKAWFRLIINYSKFFNYMTKGKFEIPLQIDNEKYPLTIIEGKNDRITSLIAKILKKF